MALIRVTMKITELLQRVKIVYNLIYIKVIQKIVITNSISNFFLIIPILKLHKNKTKKFQKLKTENMSKTKQNSNISKCNFGTFDVTVIFD